MKNLIVLFFLILPSCSGLQVASLTSNIMTYSATGKTNSDHVASLVTGKDCKITRFLKDKNYCNENNLDILNDKEKNFDVAINIIQNDSNLIINEKDHIILNKDDSDNIEVKEIVIASTEKVFNSFYFGSVSWAEEQLKRSAGISDRVGLTKDLVGQVENFFGNYFY